MHNKDGNEQPTLGAPKLHGICAACLGILSQPSCMAHALHVRVFYPSMAHTLHVRVFYPSSPQRHLLRWPYTICILFHPYLVSLTIGDFSLQRTLLSCLEWAQALLGAPLQGALGCHRESKRCHALSISPAEDPQCWHCVSIFSEWIGTLTWGYAWTFRALTLPTSCLLNSTA